MFVSPTATPVQYHRLRSALIGLGRVAELTDLEKLGEEETLYLKAEYPASHLVCLTHDAAMYALRYQRLADLIWLVADRDLSLLKGDDDMPYSIPTSIAEIDYLKEAIPFEGDPLSYAGNDVLRGGEMFLVVLKRGEERSAYACFNLRAVAFLALPTSLAPDQFEATWYRRPVINRGDLLAHYPQSITLEQFSAIKTGRIIRLQEIPRLHTADNQMVICRVSRPNLYAITSPEALVETRTAAIDEVVKNNRIQLSWWIGPKVRYSDVDDSAHATVIHMGQLSADDSQLEKRIAEILKDIRGDQRPAQ